MVIFNRKLKEKIDNLEKEKRDLKDKVLLLEERLSVLKEDMFRLSEKLNKSLESINEVKAIQKNQVSAEQRLGEWLGFGLKEQG